MQPTNPTPTPPAATDPVIELIRTQRQNVGYALLVASAICLALTGWLALKTSKIAAAPDAPNKDTKDKDDPLASLKIDGSEVSQPNRVDYYFGAGDALLACAAFGVVGAFLLARPPRPKEEEQRTEARLVVLTLGAKIGAILIAAGVFYFYQWNGSLAKWLDKGELAEARWVIIPLMIVVVGGALMFLSSQPARAEERNNSAVRKFIYGSNFGLTILMLFVVLVIANAVVAMRLPNKLDTTGTGRYTLNPQTKQLIESLEQPVHAYALFQGSGSAIVNDAKNLLTQCQDVNPSKFRATFYDPALNKAEIAKLRADYPLAEMSDEGVLLVAGDESGPDRKRHSFLRIDEFTENKPDAEGRQVPAFNGEPKLLRELMFLAENKQKPKIYFTQSSGELALEAGGRGGDARRAASGLKAYLEKNYFDVAPLTFPPAGPVAVPDDATVVVVADPAAPLPANAVEALRKYMSEPRRDGGKGKLVVLAGAQPGADRKPLALGIEPLLQTYGVALSDRFVYSQPARELGELDRASGTRVMLAMVTQEAADARNPVALGFNKLDQLPLVDCRPLAKAPGGTAQTVTVLVSQPGRMTWAEPQLVANPVQTLENIGERAAQILNGPGSDAEKTQAVKKIEIDAQMTRGTRPLAIFASEGGTARVAVFGNGWFVSDDAGGLVRGQASTLWLDLIGATLDWVRDRQQVVGISEKQYSTYTLKPGYDGLRMIWVPLGLALVAVTGLGAGVWVIRRK